MNGCQLELHHLRFYDLVRVDSVDGKFGRSAVYVQSFGHLSGYPGMATNRITECKDFFRLIM